MRFKFKSTSMDPNLVECEAERASCACAESGLGVLGDVRRQYEEMMQLLERRGGNDKLQKQVDLLRSWVGDLVAQNALLVRTVEDLETEATAKLMVERRRHLEGSTSSWHAAPFCGVSSEAVSESVQSPDVSVIEHSTSVPILVVDETSTPPRCCAKPSCPRSQFKKIKLCTSSDFKNFTRKNSCHGTSEIEPTSEKNENVKDSHRTSSVAESGAASGADSGQCSAVTRAVECRDKLMSTLQVLENKDELIRIQAESLRLLETRIAELTRRDEDLRQKLQEKCNEIKLMQAATEYEKNNKSSISVATDSKEHERVVRSLESSLAVIEELYSESFYEAAKQEKLIEMLRSDILDVRMMDKQKDTQIQKLQNVVHTQKWSLEQCQDIAMEVDSLKIEISNFLSSSNNDSGMWERDSSPSQGDAVEELREISAQLLQLRDLLTVDCTCGLEKENKSLKQANTAMQSKIAELEQRLSEKENELVEKQIVERRLTEDVGSTEKELSSCRQQLAAQQRAAAERGAECDCLTRRLRQAEALLSDKVAELSSVQRLHAQEQSVVKELKMELQRAAHLAEENTKVRDEVQRLRGAVWAWRRQLADSERSARALSEQLQRARDLYRDADSRYQEKVRCACQLQEQLDEAHARGAALCEDTRLALLTVRRWMCAFRQIRREHEEKIKNQQETIESLRQRLNQNSNSKLLDPCCSKSVPRPQRQKSIAIDTILLKSHSSCVCSKERKNSATERKPSATERKNSETERKNSETERKNSETERKNSETERKHSATERKQSETDRKHSATETTSCSSTLVAAQRMARRKSSHDRFRHRDLSPASDLEAQMSQLQEDLSRKQRRWSRQRSASHSR
ncbi:cingulin-like protein 1 isoform X2 [Plodia interpunctella]|uniref:cingulin-like protein 1 isoform X2 n=1 Tax=Plodia interpunctella TaxID=58824 RepID=UPI002367EBAA|nr:cingulin-like protein 1 isoform X2 [Plodia interpunctella]